jgi:hypothetical protein
MLAVMLDQPVQSLEAHSLGSYARARWEQGQTTAKLRQVSWDEPSLTLIVTPVSEFNSGEVQDWMGEFLSEETKFKIFKDDISIKFTDITDAVYFKLRWC